MNWLSWLVPKNSLMAATTGRMLIRVWGVMASTSWVVMRSRTDALHAGEPDPHLVLDELAHRPDAAVGEVVLVVDAVPGLAVGQVEHVGGGGEDLRRAQHALGGRRPLQIDVEDARDPLDLGTELPVELVATDPGQVVALGVEEGVLEVGAGRVGRQRLARAGPLVDLEEGVLPGGGEVALFLPLPFEEVEVPDEPVQEALVLVPEGSEQHEEREPPLAGHAGTGGDVLGGLRLDVELDPLTPVGVDGARDDGLGVATGLEDHSRGPHQLAHHDPLGAVDDEGALVRHHREVPHEDGLLLDLPGLRVHEPRPDEHRGGIGHVLLLALLLLELGRRAQVGVGRVVLELEAQLAGEVLDRADVGERLGQTLVQEPAERVPLDGDEVRQTQDLIEVGERETLRAFRP